MTLFSFCNSSWNTDHDTILMMLLFLSFWANISPVILTLWNDQRMTKWLLFGTLLMPNLPIVWLLTVLCWALNAGSLTWCVCSVRTGSWLAFPSAPLCRPRLSLDFMQPIPPAYEEVRIRKSVLQCYTFTIHSCWRENSQNICFLTPATFQLLKKCITTCSYSAIKKCFLKGHRGKAYMPLETIIIISSSRYFYTNLTLNPL